MRFIPLAGLGIAALHAQVTLTPGANRVDVTIDSKPFTTLFYGPDAPKPYLHPLRSAGGKVVTRSFPMENLPGESTSDQHHRGVWLGFKQVNGFNFWENEFSYHDPNAGKVVTKSVDSLHDGPAGNLHGVFTWLAPNGQALLNEDRVMTFHAQGNLRFVDAAIALTALTGITFGDAKDGAFSVRVAEPLIEKNSGTLRNSAGGVRMADTWGKQANWVDYSGELEGEKLGIALFDHPSSFHHPARWHVRDYGLLAVNPFGSQAFDKTIPSAPVSLPEGQTIRLRYRIVIHPALDGAAIEKLYQEFAHQ
jgi:hypothetical protein